jgi:hypothetical protein
VRTIGNGRSWTIRAADGVLIMAHMEASNGNLALAAETARRAGRLYRRAGLGLMSSKAYRLARAFANRVKGGEQS